jgi:peptide/nickel transport system substrate-binding protein
VACALLCDEKLQEFLGLSRTSNVTDLSRRTILALPLGLAVAASGARAAEPKRGGTMVMIVHPEPSTLAHYAVSAGNIPPIATQVYEGLCTYDWDQNPQPNLAKSWEVAPDGKTITFKLQEPAPTCSTPSWRSLRSTIRSRRSCSRNWSPSTRRIR